MSSNHFTILYWIFAAILLQISHRFSLPTPLLIYLGLPCRFTKRRLCLLLGVLPKLRAGVEFKKCIYICLVSKHPMDVVFKKARSSARHMRCPQNSRPSLKALRAFWNHSNALYISIFRTDPSDSWPKHQTHPYHFVRTACSHRESTERRCGKSGAK